MDEPPSTWLLEVRVSGTDEQSDVRVDGQRWCQLAADVIGSEGARGELTLTFVDREAMTALNREHMGLDGPTDVLSFPIDGVEASASDVPVLLGDVVVCPAVAADHAPEHAGTLDDELALLVVHGVLHVLGHDHATAAETETMQARERELLERHHWHGPTPAGFRQEV